MLSMNYWYYPQFSEFFTCLGFKINEEEFTEEILSRFSLDE